PTFAAHLHVLPSSPTRRSSDLCKQVFVPLLVCATLKSTASADGGNRPRCKHGTNHASLHAVCSVLWGVIATPCEIQGPMPPWTRDRKSTRLNSSHQIISYAVFS